MKVKFERTGGFAGMRMVAEFDSGSMPPEEARQLDEMVKTSDFFNLPEVFPTPEKGADYFQYALTVESKGRTHTVLVSEASVPAGLRPLIDLLRRGVRKGKA